MMNFTPQERRILIFLVATLLLGSAVSLYRHRRWSDQPEVSVVSPQATSRPDTSDSTSRWIDEKVGAGKKLDINTATAKELQMLPGIGPQLAERIVDYRQAHGPFSSAKQITEVRGIGQKTFLRIQDAIAAE
jgi:competence protein ComEA